MKTLLTAGTCILLAISSSVYGGKSWVGSASVGSASSASVGVYSYRKAIANTSSNANPPKRGSYLTVMQRWDGSRNSRYECDCDCRSTGWLKSGSLKGRKRVQDSSVFKRSSRASRRSKRR